MLAIDREPASLHVAPVPHDERLRAGCVGGCRDGAFHIEARPTGAVRKRVHEGAHDRSGSTLDDDPHSGTSSP